MRIYTKTGDAGETGLFGGGRVSKADRRVEAYGAVDELNAQLGWAETLLRHLPVQAELREIQSDLLVVGADLATPMEATPAGCPPKKGRTARARRVETAQIRRLEGWIDRWDAETAPLSQFILPGGAPGAAALHVCRAVCRRAERRVVRLTESEEANPAVLIYLNRLSDLLFVFARWVNAREGVEETAWEGGRA